MAVGCVDFGLKTIRLDCGDLNIKSVACLMSCEITSYSSCAARGGCTRVNFDMLSLKRTNNKMQMPSPAAWRTKNRYSGKGYFQ